MKTISWTEAKKKGLTRYYTGRPCKHGHLVERRVQDRHCVMCTRLQVWGADARHPERKTRRAANLYLKQKAENRLWKTLNPEQYKLLMRRGALRRAFGLTLEEYDAMLKKQRGKCAICGGKEWRNLAVDHNHETGAVRGLLCSVCNKNLGIYEKNRVKYEAYLVKYEAYLVKYEGAET